MIHLVICLQELEMDCMQNKAVVEAPCSKFRTNVLEVLKREGYIRNFSSIELKPGVKHLKIELKYQEGIPVISEIKRVSNLGAEFIQALVNFQKYTMD